MEPIKKVLVNCPQSFSSEEKLQGRTNLGAIGGVRVATPSGTTDLVPDNQGRVTVNLTDAVNVQSDWNQSNSAEPDYIKNKPAIPEKTSDLRNDSGFITSASVPTKTSDLQNDSGFITAASLPTVNDGILAIQKNGTQIGSFSANQSAGSTINVEVPVLSTFETTDDEDITTNLNGLCVYKNYGQLLDGVNGNVLALLPRPTGSADYGKFLYRNGNTIGYRDLPETAADLKILAEEPIVIDPGAGAYELNIEEGYCYRLTMTANREVFLSTDSDKTIHTRIAIRNDGTSVCGGVTLTWYDEGLAEHSITIDLTQQANTIVYNFDVYIRKATSGIQTYPIARVYDFPCSYRTGGYSGLDSTDNNMIGLDH